MMESTSSTIDRTRDPPEFALDRVEFALDGRSLLAGVDLAVRPGSFVGILGPTGAGKTTILRLLLGLQNPSAGKVLVDGKEWVDFDRAGRARVRRRIGYVQQQVGLLKASALFNVTLPLRWHGITREAAGARGAAAMASVGLSGLERKPALGLSGGERQRLAMARACSMEPDVLFLDEFTNHQDPGSEDMLESMALRHRGFGSTVVVVSHRLDQVRRMAAQSGNNATVAVVIGGQLHVCPWNEMATMTAQDAGPGPFLRRLASADSADPDLIRKIGLER